MFEWWLNMFLLWTVCLGIDLLSKIHPFFLEQLSESLVYSTYDNIIMSGDINLKPNSPELSTFLQTHSLHNHMKEKTCWKSVLGSWIDLVISNRKRSIMNTRTVEAGLSDHHLLIYTILNTTYDKLPPKIVRYRKWKCFDRYLFLLSDISQSLNNNINDYAYFERVFTNIFDKHLPMRWELNFLGLITSRTLQRTSGRLLWNDPNWKT